MSWFWCEKHAVAHRQGDDKRDCLLVGPYSTQRAAEGFIGPIQRAKPKKKARASTPTKTK